MGSPASLRIALLVYRGNPHSGGQGVYTRYLARNLVELGHRVTVFAGQPWPRLDDGVDFVGVPSLDLYRDPDPFRLPHLSEIRSLTDAAEVAVMKTGGFPEPRTFSLRVNRLLRHRRQDFDVIHDNQTFGPGLLRLAQDGWPFLGTCHHPITVDRTLDLGHAASPFKRLTLRRWYAFLAMQKKVARQLPRIVTVSESSKRDITEQMGVAADRLAVVAIGADQSLFRPLPHITRIPGRLMTTASADVPLKGLAPLLEALAKVRVDFPETHLEVVGKLKADSPIAATIERLGLEDAVNFTAGISDQRMVEMYAETSLAVVPSLYEGFSLPAVEAMACGAPLVATTGGAIPEVVGDNRKAGILVPPGDPESLAAAIKEVLGNPRLGEQLGAAAQQRARQHFTWKTCAEKTAEQYRDLIERAAHPC